MKQRRHAMSHIDEGRLAAYLDGELPAGSGELVEIELHVAACADCRKLLEEALKHRNRARSILRSGAPSATEVPAFDEILRRAGKNAATGGVGHERSRLASLAWAATIVLAVGVGWYVARNRTAVNQSVAIRETDHQTPAAPAETTMVLAEKSAEPPRSADRRREEQRSQPTEIAQAPVAGAAPAPAPASGNAQAGARADELNRAVAQPQQANSAAAAAPPDERGRMVDSVTGVAGQVLAAGAAKKLDDSDASRLAKDSPTEAAGRALVERKRAEAPASIAMRGATAPSPAPAAPSADTRENASRAAARWRETSQGTAMRQLGRLPPQVADLPVLAYYIRGNQVRVTHDLGGGQVLEVIQEKITGDSSAKLESANEAALSGSEVTEETGGYRTTLRGPLSRDSLTALLRRVR
jgi:hypothetical protein